MRLRILSDLHEEFRERLGPLVLPSVQAEVTVFAGDIANGTDVIEVATRHEFDGTDKIIVPGNHEYYGGTIAATRAALRDAVARANADSAVRARGTLHLLDDDCVALGGVRFVGGTLWTDYGLHGNAEREQAITLAERYVTDYRLVQTAPGEPFTPAASIALHEATRAFIERALAASFAGPTVVVTHHAPHPGSVAPRFAGHPVNPAFVNDLTALMGPAALWIHGHTHDSFDYMAGTTRVVANPAGYRRRQDGGGCGGFAFENASFVPDWTVSIG